MRANFLLWMLLLPLSVHAGDRWDRLKVKTGFMTEAQYETQRFNERVALLLPRARENALAAASQVPGKSACKILSSEEKVDFIYVDGGYQNARYILTCNDQDVKQVVAVYECDIHGKGRAEGDASCKLFTEGFIEMRDYPAIDREKEALALVEKSAPAQKWRSRAAGSQSHPSVTLNDYSKLSSVQLYWLNVSRYAFEDEKSTEADFEWRLVECARPHSVDAQSKVLRFGEEARCRLLE